MTNLITDWRNRLTDWLEKNEKTVPSDLAQLQEAFIQRFPHEDLPQLTLENYAVGKPDTFCYWLEFKTRRLGSVSGGSSSKWGIYWSKSDQTWKWNKALNSDSAEEAFQKLRNGLVALVEAAAQKQFDQLDVIGSSQLGLNRNGLRAKPLSLYFPEAFLPISNPYHLTHFLNAFGLEPKRGLHSKNRQLLNFLRSQSAFEGIDTVQMMAFLYEAIPPGDPKVKRKPDQDDGTVLVSEESVQLATLAESHRNLILYGPPGTGKTYTANQFAQFYLSEQLSLPISPEQQQRNLLRPLPWHEVIALALFLKQDLKQDGKTQLKVPQIADEPLVKNYWSLTETKKLSNKLWAELQIHTHPEVETVAYANRRPPFLFEKTEQSEWSLTNNGKEYVEANLSDVVDKIRKPDAYKQQVSDYLKIVTFHQSFAYEEFIEGLKPVLVEGQISYEVTDGIFKDICRRAQNDPEHKYLLIIDEINRANVAKVFGELITLIEDDKRLEGDNEVAVQLPYSKEPFGVPENLLILGTMNTADRSIALLDTALRRRFAFVEKMPDSSLLSTVEGVDLAALLDRINLRVSALMGKDYQLGHSYFMNINDVAELHLVWYQQIIPLLQEYFYNDFERLKAVLDKQFVQSTDSNAKLIGDLQHLYNLESQHAIKIFSPDTTFISALKDIYA